MTTPTTKQELRKQITDILGLEVSPDDEPDQLLEYNEAGEVTGGVDFSEEVDQLLALIAEQTRLARADQIRRIRSSDVSLNHAVTELLAFMSDQLNRATLEEQP